MPYAPNYEIAYGSKYNKDLHTKDIAKLLKKEIAAEQKAGRLPSFKVSIRTDYNHISIGVKGLRFLVLNPAHLLPSAAYNEPTYTPRALAVMEALQKMLAAYNYDGSDIQSDYFNVNFYTYVSIDSGDEYAMIKEYQSAMKAAAAAPAPVPPTTVPHLRVVG
jgi:hypothetical protein